MYNPFGRIHRCVRSRFVWSAPMNIYLAIKYHADLSNRSLIEAISATLRTAGHQVICIARDVEEWGAVTLSPVELMRRSLQAIDAADLLLVELSEKGVGLGIEAGYAHARGIPIVVIAQQNADLSATLTGIADHIVVYTTVDELARLSLDDCGIASRRETWDYITSSVDRLLATLQDLPRAALDWRPHANASSLTVLAVHIIGNIEETVWGVVCVQPVARDRTAEFAAEALQPALIQRRWQTLRSQIDGWLAQTSGADLARRCEHPRRGPMSGYEILLVVARHAAEHLAEAELTRSLWLAQEKVDANLG